MRSRGSWRETAVPERTLFEIGLAKGARLFAIGMVLITTPPLIFPGEAASKCLDDARLLRDRNGKRKFLSSAEVRKHVTHCEVARLPGNWCGKGTIPVIILINPEGKVECAEELTTTETPVKGVAEQTALRWQFKPFQWEGQPRAVLAIIPINISWDRPDQSPICKSRSALRRSTR